MEGRRDSRLAKGAHPGPTRSDDGPVCVGDPIGCSLRDEFPDDLCRGAVAAHHVGYPGLWPSRMLRFPPDQQEMIAGKHRLPALVDHLQALDHESVLGSLVLPFLGDRHPCRDRVTDKDGFDESQPVVAV
jgi:hypothetical protein